MDPMEEIKNRILELEAHKDKLKDLIPWKEKEAPQLQKELENVRAELHDLRKQLETIAKHHAPVPAAPVAPAVIRDSEEGEELRGFFA